MITAATSKDLKEVLMDSKSDTIKEPYFYIETPENETNITIVVSGKNGNEFNKTIGYFHKFPGVLIYRCIYGHGILVIQKNDASGEPKEFKVIGLRAGVEAEVPSSYGHNLVNTGKNYLVTVDNAPRENKYKDFDQVILKHGLAYYVIDKKGDVGFESNSNYNFHPQITTF